MELNSFGFAVWSPYVLIKPQTRGKTYESVENEY